MKLSLSLSFVQKFIKSIVSFLNQPFNPKNKIK
jgi:hypothetical protein